MICPTCKKIVEEILPKEIVYKPSRFDMYKENISGDYCKGFNQCLREIKEKMK